MLTDFSAETIFQNLKDAGCSEELNNSIMVKIERNQMQECISDLFIQRDYLLHKLRSHQKNISGLEELLCQLKKDCNK